MSPEVARKVEEFFSKYSLRSYKKGQVLVFPDDKPSDIMYLSSGRIRVYSISERGVEVVVNMLKPPAFLTMLWSITETPNRFFYDATTDIEIRQAPSREFITFVKNDSAVAFDLLCRAYTNIDELLNKMTHIMSGSANSRIIFELLLEARRFGAETNNTVQLHLSESELATMAGLSRETVNREMRKLKDQGLASIASHIIELHDIRSLEQALGERL